MIPAPSRSATVATEPDSARKKIVERGAGSPKIDKHSTEDLLAVIRSTCTRTFEADHESAIRALAHELGFLRVSANVRRAIQSALAAALDRAIIHNDRGIYRIDCRAIGEYPDELLQTYLLAAIGRAWKSHEEALRSTARYLGFRKVGPAMREFLEAAIAHCIRAGTLKADGDWLRRK